jgi:hypothetical protein
MHQPGSGKNIKKVIVLRVGVSQIMVFWVLTAFHKQ